MYQLTPSAIEDLRNLLDAIGEAGKIYQRSQLKGLSMLASVCQQLGYLQACIRSAIPALDRIIQQATTCELCGEPSEGGDHECCPDDSITVG